MSESKIQAWERKKRNGARKAKDREQRLIMEKLTTEYSKPFPDIVMQGSKQTTHYYRHGRKYDSSD